MRSETVRQEGGLKTIVVVLDAGEEAMACLKKFASEQNLGASQITAIGAFERATLQYFDWETKRYQDIPVAEQTEVASLIGDIAVGPDGKPALHLHAVLGRRDGAALAGHLGSGIVRPTLEVVITEAPKHLHKKVDRETGLALIRPGA